MKVKGSLCAAIFFLLLGLFGITQSLTFRYWESMALPLTVSSLIFILATVEVGKELRRRDDRETAVEGKPDTESTSRIEIRRFSLMLVWVVALMLGTYLFGFRIAVPVFAFSYLKWRGRSWLTATVFAVTVLAFLYGIFELGLKAPLFKGLIFGGR